MKVLQELLHNDILLAGILSWFVAQVIKTILYAVINKELDMTRLMGDGGMPSAHSATVTAVATMMGLLCGFGSPLFALACILAIIVMHDAMGVRLETGKQAKLLNEMVTLLEALGQPKLSMEKKLKEFVGHTPSQVMAGMLLGIVVAVVYFYVVL
ncbi:MAG: divergent PAP2 family protein [Lachnospiraceae bacterium]|nr:divergent PAP2 family protein [Lachnospiraceae bacterium]